MSLEIGFCLYRSCSDPVYRRWGSACLVVVFVLSICMDGREGDDVCEWCWWR